MNTVNTIVQDALAPARQKLLAFLVGQAESVREKINEIGNPMLSLAGKLRYR